MASPVSLTQEQSTGLQPQKAAGKGTALATATSGNSYWKNTRKVKLEEGPSVKRSYLP